jgi:hypothetical protein
MAAGLHIMARLTAGDEAARWSGFGDRLLDGLLDSCDLTLDPAAHGLLAHGAAHVRAGQSLRVNGGWDCRIGSKCDSWGLRLAGAFQDVVPACSLFVDPRSFFGADGSTPALAGCLPAT